MIAYFCTTGTYFGDSLNPANCVLEVTNPFDITTYNVYYDILEYVEKHKDKCNFEIRGISTAIYNSIFSRTSKTTSRTFSHGVHFTKR